MRSGMVCLCLSVFSAAASMQASDNRTPEDLAMDIREGQLLQSKGLLKDAENRLQSAVNGTERLVPARPALLAAALSNLASVETDIGRLAEASRLYERAIRVLVRSGGADDRIQTFRIRLAELYLESGETSTAEQIVHKVIAEQATAPEASRPNQAYALDVLACIYSHQKKAAAAEKAERESLAILEALPDVDRSSLAIGTLHMSTFLSIRKRPEEALTYAQRAREMFLALPVRQPPMEGAVEINLASAYAGMRMANEAQSASDRALAVAEKYYGPNHPKTALMYLARAAVLRRAGRKKEAQVAQKQGEKLLAASGNSPLASTVPIEGLFQ